MALQIIAAAEMSAKRVPTAGGTEIHTLPVPGCPGAPGGHHNSTAVSPPQSRLFSSPLDFAPVPIGAQLDSSVLYLEHTSHFCTSSVLLPARSLVCGHSILPASAQLSVSPFPTALSLEPLFSQGCSLQPCDFGFSRTQAEHILEYVSESFS